MIRVALVAHLSELSGSGRALLDSAAALDKSRFDPLLVLPGAGPLGDEARTAGIPVAVVDNPQVSLASAGAGSRAKLIYERLQYVRRLAAEFVRRKIDVVCVNTTASVFAGLAARRARKPIVWRVHEVIEQPSRATRFKLGLIERLADAVVYDSHLGAERFPASRVRRRLVLPNFVDASRFCRHAARADTRPELGIAPEDYVVVSNGLFSRKGADVFVEAAALAIAAAPGTRWRFVLVGPKMPDQREFVAGLKDRIGTLGLGDRIILAGLRRDMPAVLAAADLFVSPSRNEAWPIALLEAMASGVPVIATSVGDCRMMLGEGSRGVLVPPGNPQALGDAMVASAADPAAASSRATAARGWIEETYRPAEYWKPLEELIAGVVE